MTIDLKAIRQAAETANKLEELSLDQLVEYLNVVPTEAVIALLDRLEAAEKDAARYRWLRDADMTTRCRAEHYASDALNVFIDSAMGEQK